MKISDIKTYFLQAKLEQPFGWSLDWADRRSAFLVQIDTDEGITGWGEAGTPGHPAIAAVISQTLKPLLMGQDPFDREALWERMYAKMRDYGQKGLPIEAISGIDIALWDLMGKALQMPVHKLLGGAMREKVLAYATGLYYKKSPNQTQDLVQEALGYVKAGFPAIKMKIGGLSPAEDWRMCGQSERRSGPRSCSWWMRITPIMRSPPSRWEGSWKGIRSFGSRNR